MIDLYSSYGGPPVNLNWQHDIFNVSGYRERVSQDLAMAEYLNIVWMSFIIMFHG